MPGGVLPAAGRCENWCNKKCGRYNNIKVHSVVYYIIDVVPRCGAQYATTVKTNETDKLIINILYTPCSDPLTKTIILIPGLKRWENGFN